MFKPHKTLAVVLLVGLFAPTGARGQATASLVGRVVDSVTGRGVVEAAVILQEAGLGTLTDATGTFRIPAVPAGDYALRIVHLAYGEHLQRLRIEEGQELRIGVRLSLTAVELDPLLVEMLSTEEFEARSRGTRRNVITREEVARLQDTGGHLGHILARHIPGIRLRTDQSRSGEPICLEFRSPVSLMDPLACKPPIVFLDGVRVSSPGYVLTTLPTEIVENIEVIPPGEAGVAYGTDSRFGVILIETRNAASVLGDAERGPRIRRRTAYDWTEEPAPHAWKRVLGSSILGTAAGIAVGYAIGSRCLSFHSLSDHFLASQCGSWGTAGSRLLVMTLPQLGASVAAHYAGGTEMSRGRLEYALVAGSLMAAPGLVLSLTASEGGFAGSGVLGNLLLGLGVPIAVTVADRIFRGVR